MAKKPLSKLELEEANGKLVRKVNTLLSQRQGLETNKANLQEENSELNRTISKNERAVQNQQSEITDLKRALENVRGSESEANDRNGLLTVKINKLCRELEEEEKERGKLEEQLVQKNDQKICLKRAITSLNEAIQ